MPCPFPTRSPGSHLHRLRSKKHPSGWSVYSSQVQRTDNSGGRFCPCPPTPLSREEKQHRDLQTAGGRGGGPLEQAPGTAVSLCMWHQGCGSESSQSTAAGERFKKKNPNITPGSGDSLKAGHKRPKAAFCQRGSSVQQETPRPSAPEASGPPASERYPGDPGAQLGWAHLSSPLCYRNSALLILHARKASCAGLVSDRRDAARCYLPPRPPACKVIRREAGKAKRRVGILVVLSRGP